MSDKLKQKYLQHKEEVNRSYLIHLVDKSLTYDMGLSTCVERTSFAECADILINYDKKHKYDKELQNKSVKIPHGTKEVTYMRAYMIILNYFLDLYHIHLDDLSLEARCEYNYIKLDIDRDNLWNDPNISSDDKAFLYTLSMLG